MDDSVTFTRATVLTGKGRDTITFYCDLPTTFPEMKYECDFTVSARKGYGETWLIENFPNLIYDLIEV